MSSGTVRRTDVTPFDSGAAAGIFAGAIFAGLSSLFVPLGIVEITSPALRIALLFGMGACGLIAAGRVRLRLWPASGLHPWLVGLAAAVGVAVAVVILDCFLFRATLPADYVATLRQPLWLRLVYFMPRAFTENTVYRLFLISLLVLLMGRFWREADGTPASGAYWVALVLAQVVNITLNVVAHETVTPLILFYDTIRYVAPGCLWGYLFWRHGLATAEIAAVGTHLFLQPAFSIFLN